MFAWLCRLTRKSEPLYQSGWTEKPGLLTRLINRGFYKNAEREAQTDMLRFSAQAKLARVRDVRADELLRVIPIVRSVQFKECKLLPSLELYRHGSILRSFAIGGDIVARSDTTWDLDMQRLRRQGDESAIQLYAQANPPPLALLPNASLNCVLRDDVGSEYSASFWGGGGSTDYWHAEVSFTPAISSEAKQLTLTVSTAAGQEGIPAASHEFVIDL